MSKIATKFTVKIFGEGLTEWYYFDKLRSKRIFSFALEPELPVKSRSSYKNRLALIDKELELPEQVRANLIVLITDLDNIVCDAAQYKEYLEDKNEYTTKGVIFIESHPCFELWFLYHFMAKYDKTIFASYDEIKGPLREKLPGYDKSKNYYIGNTTFRDVIIESFSNRAMASRCADSSCRYQVVEGEICNRTNLHKLVLFLHMLQFYYGLLDILRAKAHATFAMESEIQGLEKINARLNNNHLFSLKVERSQIVCYFAEQRVIIPLDFKLGEPDEDASNLIKSLTDTIEMLLSE